MDLLCSSKKKVLKCFCGCDTFCSFVQPQCQLQTTVEMMGTVSRQLIELEFLTTNLSDAGNNYQFYMCKNCKGITLISRLYTLVQDMDTDVSSFSFLIHSKTGFLLKGNSMTPLHKHHTDLQK